MVTINCFLFNTLLISVLGYPYEITNKLNTTLGNDSDFLEKLDCKFICFPITKPTEIIYYLYTANNQNGEIIKPFDSDSIRKSNFNPRLQTRFLIHGWQDNYQGLFTDLLIKTFLNKGKFNVFVADWSSCAKQINYFQARCCVENVAKQIAEFIDYLYEKHSLRYNKLNLIGHSLGGHCAGLTGRNLKNGKAHTIIGLDPAKPCYTGDKVKDKLQPNDAEYVETIQTNGELLGFFRPLGQASFYPNWGKTQIGCKALQLHSCSHDRAFEYYAEALIDNKFVPIKCENFDSLKNGVCNLRVEKGVKMGDSGNYGKANGIYYVPTNKQKPFGMGLG